MDGKISLREAILYAEADATLCNAITFAPSLKGETIVLNGTQLRVKQGIRIDAGALGNASTGRPGITVDANELSRVFSVSGGTEENPIELIGLTITGAKTNSNRGGGVFIYNGGVFDARNSIVVLNEAKENADFDVVSIENTKIKVDCAMIGTTDLVAGADNYIYDASQPLFTDAANGDYTLAVGSQALDKGNNAYVAGYLTDLAGKPRLSGAYVDLGAYERQSAASAAVAESSSVASAQEFEEVASTSVWEDDEFASNCDDDVWREIEAALVGDKASRRKDRRRLFESLDESELFDVWGADDLVAGDGGFFER